MSDWLSKRTPHTDEIQTPAESGREKSLGVAYVLTLLLGWAGGHRFYLGHYLMGLLYLMSFGGFLIGWLIDLIALPWIVRKANRNRMAQITADDVLLDDIEIVPDPSMNPLSSSITIWRWTKYFVMFVMMVIAPFMYFTFFGDLFFTIVLILLYFVVVYNKEVASFVARDDFFLWSIPGLRSRLLIVVNGFAKLRRYYAGRRPVGWIRSALSVFLVPFSSEVRKEWKLFNGLLAFGMILMIFQLGSWIWEYFTLYKPELTVMNLLFDIKLINIAVGAFMTLVLVIPVVRTLTYVELAGDIKKGRILVVCAVIGVILMPFTVATERYAYEDYQRLKLRIKISKTFTPKLETAARHFLNQNFRPQLFQSPVVDDGRPSSENRLKQSSLYLTTSITLTRRFRQHVVKQKIVHRDEVNGFRVLAFRTQGQLENAEFGLLLYTGYGEGDLDWHRLRVYGKWASLRGVVTKKEVEIMYKILLERMKKMGKGDQLSPDFKG